METKRMKLTTVDVKSNSVPLDLMMEILKRLPVKTLIRFLSISKLWASIIRSRDFMKLFMNVSLTRPRGLVFLFQYGYFGLGFSSVLSQNTHESSSLTTFHVSCHAAQCTSVVTSVHGLMICYRDSTQLAIYNPCTRRSITLPEIHTWKRPIRYLLGHDPIDNDYKVLSIMTGTRCLVKEIRVLTVGTGNSWKKIENNIIPPHSLLGQEMCISGVLYYRALDGTKLNDTAIMSFDVRSEKLYLIKGPACTSWTFMHNSTKLISYEGKLAVILLEEKKVSGDSIIDFYVLVDAAKEQWSKKTFVLPTTIPHVHWGGRFHTIETDDTGEIVFAPTLLPATIFYYDLKTNRVRRAYIEGTAECTSCLHVSSNLVENLMFL